jgi:hypothetical protein
MNPRKVGAPHKETNIVDDFAPEERILEPWAEPHPSSQADEIVKIVIPDDQLIEPLEMFPVEPRPTGAAHRTAVLDFENPLNQLLPSATAAPMTPRSVPATVVRPRRSVLRSLGAIGIIAIWTGLAVIAGAALRHRVDLSVLSDYLEIVRTSTPAALRELLQPAEVVRDSAVPGLKTGATDSPPATVAATNSVTAEKPENVKVAAPRSRQTTTLPPPARAALPSARPSVSPPRTRPAASPATPTIRRGQESAPANAAAITRPAPAVPPVSAAPAAAAVSSAPPVPAVSSAPPMPTLSSAPPVPPLNAAPPAPGNSAAPASAPSSALPPADVSAPSASAAGALTAETRAVALALNRYQEAFSALDATAAHAVWPSVDVKALAKAFEQLEEQTFDLEGCDIRVTGVRAEADCAGNARYVRKVGNRALRVEPRRWHFTLRQTSNQWIIDTVDAR